jgi:hypothetical protein
MYDCLKYDLGTGWYGGDKDWLEYTGKYAWRLPPPPPPPRAKFIEHERGYWLKQVYKSHMYVAKVHQLKDKWTWVEPKLKPNPPPKPPERPPPPTVVKLPAPVFLPIPPPVIHELPVYEPPVFLPIPPPIIHTIPPPVVVTGETLWKKAYDELTEERRKNGVGPTREELTEAELNQYRAWVGLPPAILKPQPPTPKPTPPPPTPKPSSYQKALAELHETRKLMGLDPLTIIPSGDRELDLYMLNNNRGNVGLPPVAIPNLKRQKREEEKVIAYDMYGRLIPPEGDPPLNPKEIRGRYVSAMLDGDKIEFYRQTYEEYRFSFLLSGALSKMLGFTADTKSDWIGWGYRAWGTRRAPYTHNLAVDTSIHTYWITSDIVEGTPCGCNEMYFPLLRVIPANVGHYHVYHNLSIPHPQKVNRHVIDSINIKIYEEGKYDKTIDLFTQVYLRLEFRKDGE